MSQDNKEISEEGKEGHIDSFKYVENLCSGKIDGYSDDGFGKLQICMLYCYTYFHNKKLIMQADVGYYEGRKQSAINITFFGRWWQYIKDWFRNKFNKVQLDLSEKEIIKRRQLSNLKDECNKFIMPRLEQVKQTLSM